MRVLFIGNSHTYCNDMPQIFRTVCEKNEIQVSVTMLAHGGKGFLFHANEPEVRFNILFGEYDYVILQHIAHPMGSLEEMKDGASRLVPLVRQAGAEPVFYMTWREKRCSRAEQKPMTEAYLSLGQVYHCAVAPVGEVWWEYMEQHPDVCLYAEDGEHASAQGSRLAAYTIAHTLFAPNIKAIDPQDQPILQAIQTIC